MSKCNMSQNYLSKFVIADHARMRLRERFPSLNCEVEDCLVDAILFGGQLSSEYLLYNVSHQTVFPVVVDGLTGSHVVKTVLTIDQCYGNLSMRKENLRTIIPTDPSVKERVEINRKMAELESPTKEIMLPAELSSVASAAELLCITLAHKYIDILEHQYPDKQRKKEINEEVKAEHKLSNRMLERYFWGEIGKLIYEHNKASGKLPE